MERVMEVIPEDRMRKFWSLLPDISAQTIFWSGSKIDHKGFRWAPATFLGESEAIFQDFANKSFSEVNDKASTTRTDSGLMFPCAGILLNTWVANIGQNFWIRDQNKRWYRLRRQGVSALRPRVDEDDGREVSRSLVLIMKNTLDQSFLGPSPERSITCIIASIYDVDEDDDIVYANTEDIAYMVPEGDTASISIKFPFVARLVADCEQLLGLVERDSSPTPISHSETADATQEHMAAEKSLISVAGKPEEQERASEINEAFKETDSSTEVGGVSSAFEDLHPTRVKTRFEDGRLTIDMHGEHFLFDGEGLAEDQKWCLD
jgi:hypothetical protein